jgi:hypothetical protein
MIDITHTLSDEEQDRLREDLDGAVVLDGLNDAIIGAAKNKEFDCVLVYSVDKIIDILMTREQMTAFEAREWFDFNIDAHYGKRSPLFIEPIDPSVLVAVYSDDFGGAWAV